MEYAILMTREEAIKCLIDAKEEFAYFHNHCVAFDMAIKALEQPEQKKGKWIPVRFGDCKCSLCGETYDIIGSLLGSYNYCPNCGVEMEKEK